MKKNLISLLALCLLFAACQTTYAKVMTSEVKEPHMIDDTKMHVVKEKPKTAKELKQEAKELAKRKKEALIERQKAEKEAFEKAQKLEKEEFKTSVKQAKIDTENAKNKVKNDTKLLKEQERLEREQEIQNAKLEQERIRRESEALRQQAKEDLARARAEEEERHELAKQQLKEAQRKLKEGKLENKVEVNTETAKKAEETSEKLKEAKKVQKESIEDIFGDTTAVSAGAAAQKRAAQGKKAVTPEQIKEEIVEVSDKKENNIEEEKEELKDKKENKKETAKKTEEKEITPEIKEPLEEIKVEIPETAELKQEDPAVYKKNLSYEDIDKNAVSINDFLQFTDKQNEKFSVFYYKTTSQITAYNKAIQAKEKAQIDIKTSDLSTEDQLKQLRKIKKETDTLYRLRDDFYNESLEKFNSLLDKKQKTKWQILQEMGYRFLPEIE